MCVFVCYDCFARAWSSAHAWFEWELRYKCFTVSDTLNQEQPRTQNRLCSGKFQLVFRVASSSDQLGCVCVCVQTQDCLRPVERKPPRHAGFQGLRSYRVSGWRGCKAEVESRESGHGFPRECITPIRRNTEFE